MTNDLCRELERSGCAGQRLTMLFGGPHQSLRSFQRAGVQPGDRIYAVRVLRTRLCVLGVMEVSRIMPYKNRHKRPARSATRDLVRRNARIRRANRELPNELALALACIRRLSVENARLLAAVEAAARIRRIDLPDGTVVRCIRSLDLHGNPGRRR
ncbi:hypothetical protein [Streptomyces sp. NPDC023588]|uniref:hypothetical protein n=1 Tax=Streptomyces sp. NPDC023588 TaxID=3154907 RepID=UPI0033EEDD4E